MITPAPGGGQDSFKQRPAWTPYLLAIVSSILVVLIKMGLDRLFGVESAFLLLFTAVFLSALYGGTGPGLLAAVLTVAAGDYFLLRIAITSGFSPHLLLRLSIYALECVGVIAMCAAHHRARDDNERLRRDLERQVAEFQAIVAAQTRADATLRAQEEKQRFLAQAGEALASSLDYQTTLNSVARLVVPQLSDWCFVDVVTDDGKLERVAASHADPEKRAFQEDLQERYPTRPGDPVGPASVARTGKSEWVTRIPEELVRASAYDDEHFRLLKSLGLTSLLCVPLIARDRTVGVITLISAESGREYDERDVPFAEDLAHRAALAVDNARLYSAAQAEISAREQIQRALEFSEERQRLAVEGAEIGTWHWDLPTNEQIWSDKCKAMFQLPQDQAVSYESFQARLHPEDRERIAAEVAQAVAQKSDIANDYRIVWPDGSIHWMSARGRCYCDAEGNANRFEGIVQNVDVRRDAEEAQQRHQTEVEALNQRLRRAMTETHHRVKNNLQVISAMIDLQTMEETDMLPTSEFTRLSQHVRMLATVHDLLTEQAKRDNEANTLSAQQLLEKFLPLVQQMAYQRRLSFQVEDATLTSDQGTSLALIANEIYSNAIKHGNSEVNIHFYVEGETAILEVSDDGPGFSPDFDPVQAANTGLELVLNLTSLDLRGTIRFDNRPEGGGRVQVAFPIPTEARITPLF
jgi:two-component sensor histidine kinase